MNLLCANRATDAVSFPSRCRPQSKSGSPLDRPCLLQFFTHSQGEFLSRPACMVSIRPSVCNNKHTSFTQRHHSSTGPFLIMENKLPSTKMRLVRRWFFANSSQLQLCGNKRFFVAEMLPRAAQGDVIFTLKTKHVHHTYCCSNLFSCGNRTKTAR